MKPDSTGGVVMGGISGVSFGLSSLGMCKKCGNLRMIACSRCKGVGFIREGIPFGLTFVDDLYQSFGPGNLKARSIACSTCQGKGHFCCPYCS
ncbi:hypothetical protein FEM48_Zijuj04G0058800 [Ziziphus jujuba var. spinosa]|uniref:Uncharacterized protein n=1 Tax=Ziziphus jujuba var. spinosa TaxID=714518 RepID=A0A978VI64_ZIZJJ|nr:hypothetical protein FEM48_Zijuj04G0058800 [Ziziphus jujuba var. spinosa]